MQLFKEDPKINILPFEGTVNYFGSIIDHKESLRYYNALLKNIEWKNDEARIFGKHYVTARKVAWYADANYAYSYSNTTKEALPWTQELLELKEASEKYTGVKFNSCLLNLYHNGNEGMAWHSDSEKSLGKNTCIASWSFGAERKFSFKHKRTKESISLVLENASLLVMKDQTQSHWLHRLPPTKKLHGPRVNLTFRTIIEELQ